MSNRWSRISWLSNPASESDRISTGNNNDADSVSNRSPEVDAGLVRTLTEVIHDVVQRAIEPLREEIAALRAMVATVKPERDEAIETAEEQSVPRVKIKKKKNETRDSTIVERMDDLSNRADIRSNRCWQTCMQSLKKRKTSTENHMDDSRTRIRQTDDRDRCTNCLRGVLHCYNVFILILGCGALAVGIWYLVTEYSAREVSVVVGEEWFEVATYLLIGAGGTIALLAFCGCCGTMREDKCVLGFYSGTLTFMFLFLTVSCGMAFYFRRQVGIILTKDIVKHMTDTIEHQYGLDTRTNSNNKLVTDAWDSLQRQLQCCGIQGGENSSFSWSVYKLRSEWYRRNPDQYPYVPSSCCKKNANEKRCTGTVRMRAPPAIGPPLGREDLRNPDLNTEGCLDKIREHLLERAIILGLVAGSIPILLAVGIVVSCCLCLKVRRNAEDEEIDL